MIIFRGNLSLGGELDCHSRLAFVHNIKSTKIFGRSEFFLNIAILIFWMDWIRAWVMLEPEEPNKIVIFQLEM